MGKIERSNRIMGDKIICKDCDIELDKDRINRNGVCYECARRKARMKWKRTRIYTT